MPDKCISLSSAGSERGHALLFYSLMLPAVCVYIYICIVVLLCHLCFIHTIQFIMIESQVNQLQNLAETSWIQTKFAAYTSPVWIDCSLFTGKEY